MQQVARETWVAYERRLVRAQVPAPHRPDYHKWVRFYLDFCHTYGHPPRSTTSLGPFLAKLTAKNQSVEQRHQAAAAIRLLLCGQAKPSAGLPPEAGTIPARLVCTPDGQGQQAASGPVAPCPRIGPPPVPRSTNPAAGSGAGPTVALTPGYGASWEKEYRDLEASIKLRNYSRKTLAAYRHWLGKFQSFVRSPLDL